jgi:ketosteroid isomerase-like protein
MNSSFDTTARNKTVVRAYYEGGQRGDISGYGAFLHPDFVVRAPNYLPWGGAHDGEQFLRKVLPQVVPVLDFSRFSFESTTAEEDRVVALINVGVTGGDQLIKISEHWVLKDQKAFSLWVAYYEPQAVMDRFAALDRTGERNETVSSGSFA